MDSLAKNQVYDQSFHKLLWFTCMFCTAIIEILLFEKVCSHGWLWFLQIPALFIDLPVLTQSLQELPLHTRLNLETELVQVDQLIFLLEYYEIFTSTSEECASVLMFQVTTPVELPSVTVPHRTDSTLTAGLKAPQAGREAGLGVSCSVKPVPGTTPSLSVSTAVPPATDDADQELDLLLSLQKPSTEMTSVQSHTTTDNVLNSPTQGRYTFLLFIFVKQSQGVV